MPVCTISLICVYFVLYYTSYYNVGISKNSIKFVADNCTIVFKNQNTVANNYHWLSHMVHSTYFIYYYYYLLLLRIYLNISNKSYEPIKFYCKTIKNN